MVQESGEHFSPFIISTMSYKNPNILEAAHEIVASLREITQCIELAAQQAKETNTNTEVANSLSHILKNMERLRIMVK